MFAIIFGDIINIAILSYH